MAGRLLAYYSEKEEQDRKLILSEYRSLLRAIRNQTGKRDTKRIRRAFEIAAEAHRHMRRKSGEPYILHPLAVAKIVASEISLGTTSIICALLHDTVEDTEMTLEDIESEFGKDYARIINGLTKISNVVETSETTQQAENFKKILMTLADDARVILIKIADRLHNMRTLGSMRMDKKLKIASETTFIYAPLAHRLGLYEIKSELEDLSLKYTQPEIYDEIVRKLENTKKERNKFIRDFIKPIKADLEKNNFDFSIYGRSKSIHSIWNKMQKKDVSFEEVYDLFAIRIILNDTHINEKDDCWKVYSIVTNHYHPNPDRLRDWISSPKSNGYESLHTTVMGNEGKWVEVQIRSNRMNELAEKGLAAHWKYKEGSDKESKFDHWLKDLGDLLKNPDATALDLIADFKTDFFQNEIYCYTPKGDIRILPSGSTALDFAFDIHSELGKNCIGAKVNFKLVPIGHELKNGDQIEIITSKKQKPTKDWLGFVKTGKARSRIKYYLKEEKRNIATEGRAILIRKLKVRNIDPSEDVLHSISHHFQFESPLEFYYMIALDHFDTDELKNIRYEKGKLIFPAKVKNKRPPMEPVVKDEETDYDKIPPKEFELILFGSESGNKIDYKLASCCQPIPGDDVFGFLTTGEGLKIHRTNCPNAPSLLAQYGHRVVKAKWAKNKELSFLTTIKITGLDDVGVVHKITNIISGDLKVNMRSMNIDSSGGVFEGTFKVFVKEKAELNRLVHKLEELEGIHKVTRLDTLN